MRLPNDVARCTGDGHMECRDCARYLQAQEEMRFGGERAVWMTSPQEHPCEYRITHEPAKPKRRRK